MTASAQKNTTTYEEFISNHYRLINQALLKRLDPVLSGNPNADSYQENVNALVQYVFGKVTKKSRQLTLSFIYDEHFDFIILHMTRILSHNLQYDINHLYTLCDARKEADLTDDIINLTHFSIMDLSIISKQYNENRMISLLKTDRSLIKDIADMMKKITESLPELKYLPKKPKTLTDVHDVCVRAMKKVGQDNFELNQREDILKLDGETLLDDMVIRVPKTHFDLVDLGESLNFCIGNGSYSRSVADGRTSIVAVFNKSKPLYGVEFTRYTINQAHGFSNRREFAPTHEVLVALNNLLTEAPEMPDDFLPITDSKWVKGYKYNGKDLYLLLNNIIYIYFDVPVHVYEELLESSRKGTYVNGVIKGTYQYERLGHIG